MSVPVISATDENYLAPVYVMLHSLLRHRKPGEATDIRILCPSLPAEQKAAYFQQLSLLFPGAKVSFLPIGNALSSLRLNPKLGHISIATYYRFLIPQLCPDADTCLYLDGDMICRGDIAPLLSTDMGSCLLMGVHEFHLILQDPSFLQQRCQECGIPDFDRYINAGMLLMNLRRMREEDLCEKMIADCAANTYTYNDQDVLNKFCYAAIGHLPLKYNFFVPYLPDASAIQEATGDDVLAIRKDAVILHYASRKKPWSNLAVHCSEYWYQEVRKIPSDARRELVAPFIRRSRCKLSWKTRFNQCCRHLYNRATDVNSRN